MSAEIRFTVFGVPQPKGSARAFMRPGMRFPVVTSDNKSLKSWETAIRSTLQQVMPTIPRETRVSIWNAPIAIALAFYLPRPKSLPKREVHHVKRPDLDKLVRGSCDALIGVVFVDDSQVVSFTATKHYADGTARLDIVVAPYDGPLFQPGEVKDARDGSATVRCQ